MVSCPVNAHIRLNLFSTGIKSPIVRGIHIAVSDNRPRKSSVKRENAVSPPESRHSDQDEHQEPDYTAPVADSFRQRVFHVVAAIPYGQVATYGDIAQLIGSPRAARQVGGVLKRLPEGSALPWHRVINRYGQISLTGDDYLRQKKALVAEGICIDATGRINLQQYRWRYS
ncbi:6-O-methylguanine DNA methyltransferase [Yersinia pseudotuberculosis]|nr:6-O-methylguanine DNA methyltransferase [Yersinia pseudotuberculosis]